MQSCEPGWRGIDIAFCVRIVDETLFEKLSREKAVALAPGCFHSCCGFWFSSGLTYRLALASYQSQLFFEDLEDE